MPPLSMLSRLNPHVRSKNRHRNSLSISTASSTSTIRPEPQELHDSPPETAIWTCCHCESENIFQVYSGDHPVGRCMCRCSHVPCERCHFSGLVRHFVPIQEPLVVALPGGGGGGFVGGEKGGQEKEIPYGIICRECGLSWRAEEIPESGPATKMGMGMGMKMKTSQTFTKELKKAGAGTMGGWGGGGGPAQEKVKYHSLLSKPKPKPPPKPSNNWKSAAHRQNQSQMNLGALAQASGLAPPPSIQHLRNIGGRSGVQKAHSMMNLRAMAAANSSTHGGDGGGGGYHAITHDHTYHAIYPEMEEIYQRGHGEREVKRRSISDSVVEAANAGRGHHARKPSVQDIPLIRSTSIRFTNLKCTCGAVSRLSTLQLPIPVPQVVGPGGGKGKGASPSMFFSTGIPVDFPTSPPSSFTFKILVPEKNDQSGHNWPEKSPEKSGKLTKPHIYKPPTPVNFNDLAPLSISEYENLSDQENQAPVRGRGLGRSRLPKPTSTSTSTSNSKSQAKGARGIRKLGKKKAPPKPPTPPPPKPQYLIDQGHDEPVLSIGPVGRKVVHPNPLRGNEVNPMDYGGLAFDVFDEGEWVVG